MGRGSKTLTERKEISKRSLVKNIWRGCEGKEIMCTWTLNVLKRSFSRFDLGSDAVLNFNEDVL